MTLTASIKKCLTEDYRNFDGRASRREFWSFALFQIAVIVVLLLFTGTWQTKPLVSLLFDTPYGFYLLRTVGTVIELALIIPSIAVTMRRLHDSGLSGWWYLHLALAAAAIGLTPKDGAWLSPVFVIVAISALALRRGDEEENRFGPPPTPPSEHPPRAEPDFTIGPEKLWIGLRPRMAVFAVVVTSIAGLVDSAIGNLSRPDPDPFFNPDRQQVTLRDPGPDARWRTRDDAVWALSFPKALNVGPTLKYRRVTRISADDIKRIQRNGAVALGTVQEAPHPIFKTSTLKILLTLPGFGMADGTFTDQPGSALEISLPSERRAYDGHPDWGKWPTFLQSFEKLTGADCAVDQEIAPGVTRLTDIPDAGATSETDAFRNWGLRSNFSGACIDRHALRGAAYAVRDKAGNPVGLGRCETYDHGAQYGTCRFEFWLPQERVIEYRFSEEYLPILREIDSFARGLLAEATHVRATENIRHPGGQS